MCNVSCCFVGQAQQNLPVMLNLEIRFVVANRTPTEQSQAGFLCLATEAQVSTSPIHMFHKECLAREWIARNGTPCPADELIEITLAMSNLLVACREKMLTRIRVASLRAKKTEPETLGQDQ